MHSVFTAFRAFFNGEGRKGATRWLRCSGSGHMGFGSCGAGAQLPHGVWDLPDPGIKPPSPALAGGFLFSVPPGRSSYIILTEVLFSFQIEMLIFLAFTGFLVAYLWV